MLEGAKGDDKYLVFPEAAAMLERNPDGLTWRFKKIVVAALAGQQEAPAPLQLADDFDMEADGTAKLLKVLKPGARRERIVNTYRAYCAGTPMGKVAADAGCAKSTVVADLEAAEEIIGVPVIRRRKVGSMKREITRVTRVRRERGQRSASVRDWHALRTTFVTLALSAGVPVELVKRVTGHQTTAIVMEHYFRPDREQFRAALVGALPAVLTGGDKTEDKVGEETASYGGVREMGPSEKLAEAIETLQGVTGKANQERVARAVALIEGAKGWLDSHVLREGRLQG